MEKWDSFYSKNYGGQWYPSEGFVRFVARFLQRRIGIDLYEKKENKNKVLDVGCGNGRHTLFFAEQGFETYGLDISKEAINIGNAWSNKRGLKVDLKLGDMEKLPFEDNFFDVVVSFGVLDHVPFSKAKKCMKEIKRVLAPNGYVSLSLRSTESSECGRGEKVAHNTFKLEKGYEKGIIQHYFDLNDLIGLFEGFKIFDIEQYDYRFPSVFSIDKSFLQSSGNSKRYIDIQKVDMSLKESRWYISAEKE